MWKCLSFAEMCYEKGTWRKSDQYMRFGTIYSTISYTNSKASGFQAAIFFA